MAHALSDQVPLDWRVLLSGYFPEYAYDLTSLPFAELKRRSLLNDKAQVADQDPNFSERIRESLPRPPVRSAKAMGARGVESWAKGG